MILQDVLHAPQLELALLSIHVHLQHRQGCSFVANHLGTFLTLPTFCIPVDDTVNCIVKLDAVMDPTLVPEYDDCVWLVPKQELIMSQIHCKA